MPGISLLQSDIKIFSTQAVKEEFVQEIYNKVLEEASISERIK